VPSKGEGIVEFLRARYGERLALARAATPGPWEAEIEFYTPREPLIRLTPSDRNASPPGYFAVRPVAELEGNGDGGVLTAADAEYIAAHGPDVVLAEVQAGLLAVEHYERVADRAGEHVDYEFAAGAVEVQLKFRALPFAAHPDYDERWRP
jgi:hypothetical protein